MPTHRLTSMLACCGIITIALLAGCSSSEPAREAPGPEPEITDAAKLMAQAGNAFAVDLYKQLRTQEGNLFLSPHSILTVATMTYAGARGQTREQMAKVLHLPEDEASVHAGIQRLTDHHRWLHNSGQIDLCVANALWAHEAYPFLKEYRDQTTKHYGAALHHVDFVGEPNTARKTINRWVEQRTHRKIRNLIPAGAIDEATRVVLTNAIYFKGKWEEPFKKRNTHDAPFHLSPDKQVNVRMMSQTKRFPYADAEDVRLVELPYRGEALGMVVILPKREHGLAEIEVDLTTNKLNGWLAALTDQKVGVQLPRFTFTSAYRLKDTLRAMGMTDVFDLNKADLSGIEKSRMLYVYAVLHKAFIDVAEEGTEAAAGSGKALALKSEKPMNSFRADQPFLLLIRHRPSGGILFLGRVSDPLAR